MKKNTWLGLAVVATLAAGPALAADYGSGYAPYAPAYRWTGPYIGANLGYQWSDVSRLPLSPSGVTGGIQAGYLWQNGQFVFGGETDLQLSGADDTFAAWKFSNRWFGTLRARAGWALDNILLYGTAGLAYGDGDLDIGGLSESHTHVGWTAGLGIEVGFTPNWSAKAEYLYVDLGAKTYVLTGVSHAIDSNILRMGINYRF
jgi:outer membrane immunogenic protein